jgi:mobilome CxxCx(11)CxxC protein
MPVPAHKIAACTTSAIESYGTGYIFELRAKDVRWKIRWLTFLGIASPVLVGTTFGAYSLDSKFTTFVLALTAVLSIPLAILSVWSLVSKWDDTLSYSLESKSDNYRLSKDFRQLSADPNIDPDKFDRDYAILDVMAKQRKALDERYDFSEEEKRHGMRAGLRQIQYPCAGCKQVPMSLKSTDCPVCGQF